MSYHFGWSIEYILSLTPVQFTMIMEGLGEILKQKYDPNYKNEAKEEAMRLASEMKAKKIVEKKGKGKLSLNDIM